MVFTGNTSVSGQPLIGVSVQSGVTIQATTGTFANLSGVAYATDISGAISGYALITDAYAAASGAVADYMVSGVIVADDYQVSGSYQTSGAYYQSGDSAFFTNVGNAASGEYIRYDGSIIVGSAVTGGTGYVSGDEIYSTSLTNASGMTTYGIIATRCSATTLEANAIGDNLKALIMVYGARHL